MDQYFRHQQVLKLLPGEAQALDVGTIRERLEAQGIEVDKRTVQRDLNYLSRRFSVRSKPKPGSGKARIWWTDKVLPQFCLSPTDAMSLVMLMEHAKRFGMAEQVKNLGVLDNYARSLLSEQRPAEDWSKKIISNTRFITLQPGKVDPEVLKTLQQALLEDSAVKARYLKRGTSEPKNYLLKPLGLSYQDSNIYLSCVFAGKEHAGPVALPVHRFVSVRTVHDLVPTPASYDINSVEAQRSLVDLKSDEPIRLVLQVDQRLYERLTENPLSADQQLFAEADGRWRMTGTLLHGQGLELWLLSQGDMLQVIEPVELREQMTTIAHRMAANYKS